MTIPHRGEVLQGLDLIRKAFGGLVADEEPMPWHVLEASGIGVVDELDPTREHAGCQSELNGVTCG